MSKSKASVNVSPAGKKAAVNFIRALLIGFAVFLVFLAVFSLLIMNVDIPDKYFWIFVLVSSAFSALVCSFAASVKLKSKALINGMLADIVLLIAEFIILLCFNNAQPTYNIYFIIPAVIVFGFLGCVAAINIKFKH